MTDFLHRKRRFVFVATIATVLTLVACGGFPDIANPVGEPLLPDLVPEPPVDLRVTFEGRTTMVRFSSTLVNVGEGDFVLRSSRDEHGWTVEQELWYSESGGELLPTDADMAWGGDGHDHWHIHRVASYRMVPLDEDGEPVEDDLFRVDSKIGFCFYDHTRALSIGPEDPLYNVHSCGHEDDDQIRMGMSPGWSDIYDFTLPGQSVDITVVPDGAYRLWAEADAEGWFTEATRDNNVTWIDFDLKTDGDLRFATLLEVGPRPSE